MNENDSPSRDQTSRPSVNRTVASLSDEYDPESRARALQSLLIEEGLLSTDAVDNIVATYEDEIGPLNGAKIVAKAWTDELFRERLLEDALPAIEELDVQINGDIMEIEVLENAPDTHNVVVCTLCSCYPWAILGLPPTWYKSAEYRSRIVREPREILTEEFAVELDSDTTINVWDSTSELRYFVLPQRPPETQGLDEHELVDYVTRDSMIGVDRLV